MLPRQHPVSEEATAILVSKRMTKRSVILPVSLCLLDIVLTLCGQSNAYWDGEFQDVIEASPAFAGYLAIHPGIFVAAGFVWIGTFTALVSTLPAKLGRIVFIAVSIGHAVGCLAWLVRIARENTGGMENASENSTSSMSYFRLISLIVLIAFVHSVLGNSAHGKPRKTP